MHAVVTGGAGYIGSSLVHYLSQRHPDLDVTAVDNEFLGEFAYLEKFKPTKVRMVKGDVTKTRKLREIFRDGGVDVVLHLAAIPGLDLCTRYPRRALLTNVYGTLSVLEAAVEANVNRVVFTSSMAVYGESKGPLTEELSPNPINVYGVHKAAAEQLLKVYERDYGLPAITLRVSNVYGIGLYTHWTTVVPKFVKRAVEGRPLTIYGDGTQARDFIHIRDVVRAIDRAMELKRRKHLTLNVASGKSTTVNEIADAVRQMALSELGRDLTVIHQEPKKGEVYLPRFEVRVERSRKILGCEPTTDLPSGMRELLDYALKSEGRR